MSISDLSRAPGRAANHKGRGPANGCLLCHLAAPLLKLQLCEADRIAGLAGMGWEGGKG